MVDVEHLLVGPCLIVPVLGCIDLESHALRTDGLQIHVALLQLLAKWIHKLLFKQVKLNKADGLLLLLRFLQGYTVARENLELVVLQMGIHNLLRENKVLLHLGLLARVQLQEVEVGLHFVVLVIVDLVQQTTQTVVVDEGLLGVAGKVDKLVWVVLC